MDKASMTLGWLVGRQIAGQRRTQEKQPIAYLYNGVQLPPLPEWDKEMYPYAVLTRWSRERWRVYYSPEKAIYKGSVSNPLILTPDSGAPVIEHILNDGVWGEGIAKEDWAMTNIITEYWWANHDILNDDGSVYLAASDPIPVYDPDEPEKQLIGYSYNGVVLPDINKVWTDELKQQYPYAVVAYLPSDVSSGEMYVICISTAPMYINTNNFCASSPDLTASLCVLNSGVWGLGGTIDFGAEDITYPISVFRTIWSSYDVLWDDGSVFSAATDPIPVYNTGQTETVVYDDIWPIEWIPSAMTNNLKYYDIVKVSNLTPTAEKMQSAVLTLENQVFNCTSTNTAMDGVTVYVYTDADGSNIALLVVSDNSLTDNGLYVGDLGDRDCKFTLSL